MKVLIAGGGIGGLTAALCLQKVGHEVQVFEQASAFSQIGAGLQCGANALKVLDYLGLLSALKAVSVAPLRADFRHYKTGGTLHSINFGGEYAKRYGAPYFHIHRADLHQILSDQLIKQDRQSIQFNSAASGYTETADKVTLNFIDGRSIDGDCLVACDGIRSVLRQQLLGNTKVNFTGNVAWRGIVAAERLPKGFMDKVVSNFVGPRKHMVIYYLRQQQLVNFVGVVEDSEWRNESWTECAPWQQLKQDFDGWHPAVQTLIDAVDKQQCYRWALYDHKPFASWSSQRVTLLGDAAHATLPFMAAGAAMAIEDARILQRALDQTNDVAKGLALYQHHRYQRTAKVQLMSAKLGRIYHLSNSALQKTAFMGLKVFGKKSQAFLPGYDANKIILD